MIDKLACFAKPFHRDGLALLRKAKSIFMERLCFAKHFLRDGLALLRKAFHRGLDELIWFPFYFFSLDFCSIFARFLRATSVT